uniref:HMG box domain-containing protein n=1 Tax=Lotus japonicus TaxID=34305 RepID=I3T9L0_LOTJA|nr:unknown [Lotus japonicus]
MVSAPRLRKRVFPLLRAPDGSAFQICELCEVSVAVALADLHHCETKMASKIFKGKELMQHSPVKVEPKTEVKQEMQDDDPEEEQFMKDHDNKNYIEADRMGFEKWKSMSKQVKLPYTFHAFALKNEYVDDLLLEAHQIAEVSDEADSAYAVKDEKVNDEADSVNAVKVEKVNDEADSVNAVKIEKEP